MTNKTISELPNFTGDTSMRLHVHKPGSSESLSLNDIGNLVTTGEGLQTGDVVLRPTGFYADALECDGAVYEKSVAPILSAKLNDYADSGVTPVGINANSETRFETVVFRQIYKLGNYVLAVNNSGNGFYFYNGKTKVYSVNEYGAGSGMAKTRRAFYCVVKAASTQWRMYKYNDLTIRATAYHSTSQFSLVGIAEYYGEFDVAVVSDSTGFRFVKTNALGDSSYSVIHSLGLEYDIKSFVRVGAKYFVIATVDGESGLYEIILSDTELTFQLHIAGYTSILEGESSYIYAIKGNAGIYQVSPDTKQELLLTQSDLSYKYKQYGDAMFIYTASAGTYISFDMMRTWVKGPTLSGYNDCDYSNGEFVFVGGSGTTGSVNGQSGTIQMNAASFAGDLYFKVPNISSMAPNFKQYILK
ncbi:hypothetical protein N7335_01960 [Stutzerimonas stutzeri]|uniref:Uncharacterized protein n=1 Tax=Stutzerimonas stutzeri TaxID=316 RepID=A0AA42KN30_STUST|nr:hypothetical protein [Stutzerimonas stutzeri]MDH0145151.1 hypothetical protein [Stutzerimonas stutzeri]MDH0149594.1 hypothetical protein [Stutzerimonas stutzeri]